MKRSNLKEAVYPKNPLKGILPVPPPAVRPPITITRPLLPFLDDLTLTKGVPPPFPITIIDSSSDLDPDSANAIKLRQITVDKKILLNANIFVEKKVKTQSRESILRMMLFS